jgi:hypothetical protein
MEAMGFVAVEALVSDLEGKSSAAKTDGLRCCSKATIAEVLPHLMPAAKFAGISVTNPVVTWRIFLAAVARMCS